MRNEIADKENKYSKGYNYLINVTGYGALNLDTGEWLKYSKTEFSDEAKEALLEAINKGYSVKGYAYRYLSADEIRWITKTVYESGITYKYNLEDVDIWKYHSSTIYEDHERGKWYFKILGQGINILDNIDDIINYDVEVLELIYKAALKKKNICKMINPNYNIYKLKDYVDSLK